MTFKGALWKKFGKSLLRSLFIYARVWHIFRLYASEYEKTLDPTQKQKFREIFGEP